MLYPLQRWLWLPAGFVVAVGVAMALGSGRLVATMMAYAGCNAAGTLVFLQPWNDMTEDAPGGRRVTFAKWAFVLQLPYGLLGLLDGQFLERL